MTDQPPAANQSSAVIISAGTDGRICLWDVTAVVTRRCPRSRTQSQSSPALNCVEQDDMCFTSLTETVSAAVAGQPTQASDTLATSSSTVDTAGSCELTKASERQGSELEPCCVITAHQSGVNSLAVRQRLTGSIRFVVIFN